MAEKKETKREKAGPQVDEIPRVDEIPQPDEIEVLRRLLATPPQPRKAKKGKAGNKSK